MKRSVLICGSRSYKLDERGHLLNPEEWNEDVAHGFAREKGRRLTKEHLAMLRKLRELFSSGKLFEERALEMGKALGFTEQGAEEICKIAGLPKLF